MSDATQNLTMTPKQRVMAAMNFQRPDRTPRYWQSFWSEFQRAWDERHGPTDLHRHFGDDMKLVAPIESTWPSRAGVLERRGDMAVVRSGWGEVKLTQPELAGNRELIGEMLRPAVAERVDPDTLVFEDPLADVRFDDAAHLAGQWKDRCFVWCKSGGPYLRAAFMRGEEEFWIDCAEDPTWVRAFVDRVVDHIITVAIEGMKRFGLTDTGIAIYDDVAANWGPFVGPNRYAELFLPALKRMVSAYKNAGARWVMHHSDGNVLPILDMWIDAGVDAINPIEYRCGMDPVKIRQQYGNKLVLVGGLDNTGILPRGDRAEIKEHIDHLLSLDTGYILGPHSIGPDISPQTMAYVLELLDSRAP